MSAGAPVAERSVDRTVLAGVPRDVTGFHPVGRLPMHGIRREPEVSLDGIWEFQLLPSPDAVLGTDWDTTTVPGLWTMTELSDPPHYTNVPMPFDEVPPALPERNPTGVYRRTMQLRPEPGRRLILHVGAAESVLRVLLNGEVVGVSSDAHLAAEFDVTEQVRPGDNELILVVQKYSAESYLEDQDQWWHGGISRSVFLYSVPEVRLADVAALADYDPESERGTLRVRVSTAGLAHLPSVDWTVEVQGVGRAETAPVTGRLATQTLPKPRRDRSNRPEPRLPDDMMDLLSLRAAGAEIPARLAPVAAAFAQTVAHGLPAGWAEVTLDDLDVPPWTAETPHLEGVVVRLRNGAGTVVDEARMRVGFRRVEIRGRDLLVNGRRPLFQGVNRHDSDPRTGRVMSRERMLAELSLLKRMNVNAIRTSHYPNDPVFLGLCDELGFYVIDEADIEGHAFATQMADDPEYLPSFLRRYSRMVLRDRNHPSVVLWSLGNETGYGAAHDAMAAWSRRVDPSRPVHYEGAVSEDWHGGHAATDVVCPMYPSFPSLEAYSADERADRPLILCEYAYSQGNSTGGLDHYWKLFETLPGLQGGFLWEFLDHGLDPDGDGRYRYGGDFGDQPNDGPVLLNGVAFPDLTPKPALLEARGIFSPFRITSGAQEALAGGLTIRNRQTYADLAGYELELRAETTAGPEGAVVLPTPDVAPGADAVLELPRSIRDMAARDSSLALTLTVRTRADAAWAPAGTEIAVHQIVLPTTAPSLPSAGTQRATLGEDGELRHPLLAGPPRLALWRALTENDASFALDNRFVRSGFFSLEPTEVAVGEEDGGTVVTTRYATAFGDEVTHRRRILAVGDSDWVLTEDVALPPGTRDGLRVGMRFELPPGFDEVEWVGLGPWENYPDRRASALLGRWTSTVDDLAVPYVVPQENGTRGGVTELVLAGAAGVVRARSADPLHLNVSRYAPHELEQADHWWELPPSERTIVHLDVAHRGVGTGRLGPDTRPDHRLDGDRYRWVWRLTLQPNR
ncbi:glycoside hydrolase family 2 TIM barrel-domain containing protein [Naasia sp. SYSU D00948]|uniref:glycoside hydrolase family 2 TIM barrel-domain containing protein n=1 Tax=Naasia sp. SYSU D00948 TaxID=2817379 RepID=UPI001B300FB7|nr:glycoside hydrolase family 2 TIM barrel-domain containing protein [Naasia sp. SYSU D00948]